MSETTTPEKLHANGWKVRVLSGFMETGGPLWTRREGDAWAYGVLCGPQHLNPAGLVHGGLVLTLLDHAISSVAWEASERAACVTVQLDTHFVGAVKSGEFVEARAEVVYRTRSLIFMRGTVVSQGNLVLSGQAILKALPPATPQAK